jgi:uncharacterized protein (DUF302 family)
MILIAHIRSPSQRLIGRREAYLDILYPLGLLWAASTHRLLQFLQMADTASSGIVTLASPRSVEQTLEKLEEVLRSKGVPIFALIDHSGEAERAGMKMPPTKLLIFGNPKAGTPVMLASPSIAIDLPLKILVWEDENGKVWISYNSLAYLQGRHAVPQDLLRNLAAAELVAAKTVE